MKRKKEEEFFGEISQIWDKIVFEEIMGEVSRHIKQRESDSFIGIMVRNM